MAPTRRELAPSALASARDCVTIEGVPVAGMVAAKFTTSWAYCSATNSPYTSWTTDPEIAKDFAGSDGVILRIPNAPGAGYGLVTSPDLFGESEVLVEGNVIDAQRFFAPWEGLGG